MAEVVSAWQEAVAEGTGRWEVTWRDLGNVLVERAAEEFARRPWHEPEPPGVQAERHRARPRGGADLSEDSDFVDSVSGDSD